MEMTTEQQHSTTTISSDFVEYVEKETGLLNGQANSVERETADLNGQANSNSSSIVEMLRREFQAEIGAVKTENQLLLAKVDSLQVQNGELKSRLDGIEAEAMLAKEQMTKAVEEKVSIGLQLAQLEERLMSKVNDKIEAQCREMNAQLEKLTMKSKMAEEQNDNSRMQQQEEFLDAVNYLQENQQKFNVQQEIQEMEVLNEEEEEQQLEEDKQLEQAKAIANLSGKMVNLESQQAIQQSKLDQLTMKLADLVASESRTKKGMEELGNKLFKIVWSTNQWHTSGQYIHLHVSADGMFAESTAADENSDWTNVRAKQPVSCEILASMHGLPLVYYEVLAKNCSFLWVGWAGVESQDRHWIGSHGNSNGKCQEFGHKFDAFVADDERGGVLGTGFLRTKDGKFSIFFTRNGLLYGKPKCLNRLDLLLYPAVKFFSNGTSVEANFGGDPEKPFKFDFNAHKAQLLNWNE